MGDIPIRQLSPEEAKILLKEHFEGLEETLAALDDAQHITWADLQMEFVI